MKRVLLVLATVLLFASCDLNLDLKKRGFVKVSDRGTSYCFEECEDGGINRTSGINCIIYTDGETFIAVNDNNNDERYIIDMGPYSVWAKKYCDSSFDEEYFEYAGKFFRNGEDYYVNW